MMSSHPFRQTRAGDQERIHAEMETLRRSARRVAVNSLLGA